MGILRLRTKIEAYSGRALALLCRREFKRFDGAVISWHARVDNPQHMEIGHGVSIRRGSWLYAVTSGPGGDRFTPTIVIGDGVYLGHALHLTAVDSVVIEDNVMIADGVYISDNFHDYRDIGRPVKEQRIFSRGGVRICAGAFVGEGARIVGPVTVGRNAVIGSNAVVTKDIPERCIAVGIPARVVKRYDPARGEWMSNEAER